MNLSDFRPYMAKLLTDAASWFRRAARDIGFAIAAASFLFWVGYALGARDVDARVTSAVHDNAELIKESSAENSAQRAVSRQMILDKIEATCGPVADFRPPAEE